MLVLELLEESEAPDQYLILAAAKCPAIPRELPVCSERLGAQARRHELGLGALEEALEPEDPLVRIVESPELLERSGDLQPHGDGVGLERPGNSSAQVVLLEQCDIHSLTAGTERAGIEVGSLGDRVEVLGMSPVQLVGIRSRVEPLHRVLPDRVEHPQAAAAPSTDKTLDDERLDGGELRVADGLRRFEGEASPEDREFLEELLLLRLQQLKAPFDRRAERLLPRGASRERETRSGRLRSSRASSSSGSSRATRAAASSIASGSPSSRRQISPTAPAGLNPGATARARSPNSSTASSSGSGSTGYRCSDSSCRGSRLVASTRAFGVPARSAEMIGAPRSPARSCRRG